MTDKTEIRTVALIGIGLIGSSIARGLRAADDDWRVRIHDSDERAMSRAMELGIADTATGTPGEAAEGCDIVILCTPLGTYARLAEAIAPVLKRGSILTDVGSVKQCAIRDIGPAVPQGVHFIPGHPVAGTEQSGVDAGFAELFQDRWCILTPPPGANSAALETLTRFWEALGSRVDVMDPHHHDLVLGITSHLPHLIAYNIVGTASDLEEVTSAEVIKYSAGGFRDFTRIAASDPIMWRDVFLNNRDAVLEVLGRFSEDLAALQRAIRWGDGDALFDLFTRTRAIRRSIIDAGQEIEAPDFGRRPPSGRED